MANLSTLMLKFLLLLISASWIILWILKPTQVWTKTWKAAEEKATSTIFGYYGLNFATYTFPVIAVAIIGFIYMEMRSREQRSRRGRGLITVLSNPLVVNRYLGILSGIEILAICLFVIFLAWTFYARISNDFKKMLPVKSFKLSIWQYKLYRMATRFGLLAEACLALLLLPILRGMAIFRLLGIQFEASVRYHIWLGTAMILFATLHGAGTFFIWGIKHRIQDEMWKWQKSGRIYLAGEITLVAGLAIWITSLPQIRRKYFELFYYTHHLYMIFLISFLFHAGDRHFYMVFPGIFLFGLDKVLRIIQSRPATCILSARVFPNKTIELSLPKDPSLKYTPTSIIFMKIPSISKFQWHSFSLTSSSSVDEYTMSIMIKTEGWWTTSLYNMIQAEPDSEANLRKCIPVAVEGPYGPASQDFLRYDSLLLVAGGIGITPFLSILQEIAAERNNGEIIYPSGIQLIYTVKNSQDISILNPILPQLLDVERFHLKVKVFVTQENQSDTTLREILNDLPQRETLNFNTSGSSYATYGLEKLPWMAAIAAFSSIMFIGFLSCFNHIIIPTAKNLSSQKTPSSVIDLLLICSFAIAIICSSLMAIIFRWKRLKKELSSFSDKPKKEIRQSLVETSGDIEEHEIHFGGRPNFKDLFSKFSNETGTSNIGVLVCGPETMKKSVASACQLSSQAFNVNAQEKKPNFSFHSLNFTL